MDNSSANKPNCGYMSFFSKDLLFALSLFPYLGFLWFLTQSGQTPRLALIGFYMTLLFVAVTIPAGIVAKVVYGNELANVDWLHGGAEFFLTLANIFVVLGFRQAITQLTSPPLTLRVHWGVPKSSIDISAKSLTFHSAVQIVNDSFILWGQFILC
jgi:hypothetical protein